MRPVRPLLPDLRAGSWHANDRELRRVGVYETRQPKGRGLKAIALHVVALHPFHPAQIDAHGESGSEDLAYANSDIPAVVGVSLPRPAGLSAPKKAGSSSLNSFL